MVRTLGVALVCAFLLSSVFVAVNASSGGSDEGSFPNRVFSVDNVGPWPVKDVSYLTTVTPDGSGDWWVELTQVKGSYVLVQVYTGSSLHTKSLSSTDLRTVGDDSKKTFMSAGGLYTVAFTCYGKRASATLAEHFEPGTPAQYVPHDPILIQGNSQFTAENGVVGGDGSSSSPYVISGWEIDASSGADGVKIEWTSAYFVIRDCYIHSAPMRYHGVYLYFLSNGVVENCVLSANWAGLFAYYSSSLAIRTVQFDQNAWSGCNLMGCTDSSFTSNVVETDNLPMSEDWGLRLSGCERITVQANSFYHAGISFWGETREDFNTHLISDDNTVDGLPILYIANSEVVGVVGQQYGQVFIVCSTHVQVMDMVMSGYTPLYLAYVDYGTVEDCEFTGVVYTALELFRCSNLLVRNNWFHDNLGVSGKLVLFSESPSITFLDNTIENSGLALSIEHDSTGAFVIGNKISNCGGGIMLFVTSDALVKWNEIRSCVNGEALILTSTSGIIVEANTIDGNFRGIYVDEMSSSNKIIYNNISNNVQQVVDRSTGSNAWDDVIGCGNYWSDYSGVDADGNGIGDTPYHVSDHSTDNFPMMQPWSGFLPGAPVLHDPILITSDSEFTAENGVRSGSGGSYDPFVIEGWYIDGSADPDGFGIQVANTEAYFLIRHVEVTNGDVSLRFCENAVIEDSTVSGQYDCIAASDCPGVTISRNTLVGRGMSGGACIGVWDSESATITDNVATGGLWGIWLAGGSYPVITGNLISGNQYGIGLHSSLDSYPYVSVVEPVVSDNVVVDNNDMGIWLMTTCQDAIVSGNIVARNLGDGIIVSECDMTIVQGNTISDNGGSGVIVQLLNGYGNIVVGNEISGNGVGVTLQYTSSPLVYGNDIVGNTIQAIQDSLSWGVRWDNALPDGGNYWSDYGGADANGDGIGDTAYMIDSTNMDRYPLMQPCVP